MRDYVAVFSAAKFYGDRDGDYDFEEIGSDMGGRGGAIMSFAI